MKAFIKATEVWVPSRNTLELEWVGGEYGELENFKDLSVSTRFAYDAGLPGKAWAAGHPLILPELEGSFFLRADAAKEAGITAGIALPVFAGRCLQGVVLFLCGQDETSVGAIEVWHCDEESSYDLQLMEGYFGTLDHFEFLSRHTSFRKGTGLPGSVWETGMPVLMNDLGTSHQFMRAEEAAKAGITSGFGIPCFYEDGQSYLMTFLSARGTPIARQIEVWVPDAEFSTLQINQCYSESGTNLLEELKDAVIPKGEGLVGRVFVTGVPEICNVIQSDNAVEAMAKSLGMHSLTAIPVLENGVCKAVVVMYS